MTDILQTEGLGISFGGLKAVSNVDLAAKANNITTVIGPNGAGKTTLFNLISGALKPGYGRVVMDGRDVTGRSPAKLRHSGWNQCVTCFGRQEEPIARRERWRS
jgi:branched-chain amino acid transport system ATP-binding protein